jgi:hypothetical protein
VPQVLQLATCPDALNWPWRQVWHPLGVKEREPLGQGVQVVFSLLTVDPNPHGVHAAAAAEE